MYALIMMCSGFKATIIDYWPKYGSTHQSKSNNNHDVEARRTTTLLPRSVMLVVKIEKFHRIDVQPLHTGRELLYCTFVRLPTVPTVYTTQNRSVVRVVGVSVG